MADKLVSVHSDTMYCFYCLFQFAFRFLSGVMYCRNYSVKHLCIGKILVFVAPVVCGPGHTLGWKYNYVVRKCQETVIAPKFLSNSFLELTSWNMRN